jgi:hypothetical protein
MQLISKQEIGQWLYLNQLSEKLLLEEKIRLYEKKYNQTLKSLEKHINSHKTEDFEKWDDYIEWKAYKDILVEINKKIDDIRNGFFQVA